MPNNPRQAIKRDLDRALNHVDWIKQILAATGEKYVESHPEIVEQYKVTFALAEELAQLVTGLRDTY